MRMRKSVLVPALSVSVVGGGMYLLRNEHKRNKLINFVRSKWNRGHINKDQFPIEKAGLPDPENIQDNTMVSEGAQFGVQYYNHVSEDGRIVK